MARTAYPDQSGQAEQAGRGISVSILHQTKEAFMCHCVEILKQLSLNVLEPLEPITF